MIRVQIGFWNVDAIMKFIDIAARYEFDINLVSGSSSVDAKSLLSVLSMHNTSDMELEIHTSSCEDFLKAIDVYLEQGKLVHQKRAVYC